MAVETEHAHIGALVTCNSYRNPNLLADMARTIDHLSDGRFVLGIGVGLVRARLRRVRLRVRHRAVAAARPRRRRSRASWSASTCSTPPPRGRVPILIGGSGEKVTLRLTAEHADAWNSFGPPDAYAEKNRMLDEWCEKLDRNPRQIERTVGIKATEIDDWQAYLDAGAEHLIVMAGPPFDLDPIAPPACEIARG